MRARDRELEIEIEEKDRRGEEKRDPYYVRSSEKLDRTGTLSVFLEPVVL